MAFKLEFKKTQNQVKVKITIDFEVTGPPQTNCLVHRPFSWTVFFLAAPPQFEHHQHRFQGYPPTRPTHRRCFLRCHPLPPCLLLLHPTTKMPTSSKSTLSIPCCHPLSSLCHLLANATRRFPYFVPPSFSSFQDITSLFYKIQLLAILFPSTTFESTITTLFFIVSSHLPPLLHYSSHHHHRLAIIFPINTACYGASADSQIFLSHSLREGVGLQSGATLFDGRDFIKAKI